ncbi:hypothetical protein [Actinacidiphila acididurans]|uniref:Integral membrane protein n=1 Tax=Actinacidiphila acididurans TaxID=2784346 RepID=A0ABS2TYL9_9ACTN|nr:hypothetical protein [Actinacidiphila acididurans]MBM9508423.1 hypothetical protein [Actinacidiphila acididurans]
MSLGQDGPPTRTRMPEGRGGPARRPPQPRRALVTVVSIVVLLIAAIAFANRGGHHSDASSPGTSTASGSTGSSASDSASGSGSGSGSAKSGSATAPSGTAPVAGHTNGIPSGFAHTQQGAQSAAANYAVALGGTGMFDTGQRHVIVNTIADASAVNALQGGFDRDYNATFNAQVGLTADGKAPTGQTFVSRTLPAGAKTTQYDGTRADVAVWCLGLFGLAGTDSTKPVTSSWFTVTFQLRWNGSDWKVVTTGQTKGPTPVSGDNPVSTADEIAGAVQGFGGFTYAR